MNLSISYLMLRSKFILEPLTANLTLSPDASIDLHMHTSFSDGRWPVEQLIDYLVAEHYDMVAITDHDRVDTVASNQELAAQKNLPVLAGVEMSTDWHGTMGHVLGYGFEPHDSELLALREQVVQRQLENTRAVYKELRHKGYEFPPQQEELKDNGGHVRLPLDHIR